MIRARSAIVVVAACLALGSPGSAPAETGDGSRYRPPIVRDLIPYGAERQRQMGRYSKRHYGRWAWRLRNPQVIVLHFTGGSTYESARSHFASNSPSRGELPGVCTHFIVDKDGTIYEVVRSTYRCRHAIGLNYTALGIEMVQETGSGSHWAARQILKRRPQIRAALRLARYLKVRYEVRMRDLIGHAMANDSPYFKDLMGWRNDHTDWLYVDVKEFRRRLRNML